MRILVVTTVLSASVPLSLAALLIGSGLIGSGLTGCATSAGAMVDESALGLDDPLAASADLLSDAGGMPDPIRLPTPETAPEAQFYMKGAIAALRAGEPEHSAMFLEAILRSDHLTDRGRANVYWLLAEARRIGAQDQQLIDALGGFLIAASVVPEDIDIQERTEEARATLDAARGRLALVAR